jgi:protein-tyrosine phosphatase
VIAIYAGETPDQIDRGAPVARLRGTVVEVADLRAGHRTFFELEAGSGGKRVIAERRIPLEGAHNFRDLGGYAASDGRRLRWGRLYRSDHLGGLTAGDLERLSQLGVRLVCDFRTDAEREEEPDRLPTSNPPEVLSLPIGGKGVDPLAIREKIASGDLGDTDFAEMLTMGNRAFVTGFRAEYAAMLKRVADPASQPALVHCTAGKDRAGFASAVLLMALGVPRETILADFLLTNVYTEKQAQKMVWVIRFASFFRLSAADIRPLFGVQPGYLQAAFDAIDEHFGSDDAFLRDGLGLQDEARAELRAQLLF